MNMSVILAAAAGLTCCVVNSLVELDDPIRYVDPSTSYFIGIKGTRYRMGTPLDAITDSNMDVPQFSGDVRNCSSDLFGCRAVAFLVFVSPKKRHGSVGDYSEGVVISFKERAGGTLLASAKCPRATPAGCAGRSDGGGPAITYQYTVSRNKTLNDFNIQYWDDNKTQIYHQSLRLVSRVGLDLR